MLSTPGAIWLLKLSCAARAGDRRQRLTGALHDGFKRWFRRAPVAQVAGALHRQLAASWAAIGLGVHDHERLEGPGLLRVGAPDGFRRAWWRPGGTCRHRARLALAGYEGIDNRYRAESVTGSITMRRILGREHDGTALAGCSPRPLPYSSVTPSTSAIVGERRGSETDTSPSAASFSGHRLRCVGYGSANR